VTEANAESSSGAHAAKCLGSCLEALVVILQVIVQQVADAEVDGTSLFRTQFFRGAEVQAVE
jgi:hypothetical protein